MTGDGFRRRAEQGDKCEWYSDIDLGWRNYLWLVKETGIRKENLKEWNHGLLNQKKGPRFTVLRNGFRKWTSEKEKFCGPGPRHKLGLRRAKSVYSLLILPMPKPWRADSLWGWWRRRWSWWKVAHACHKSLMSQFLLYSTHFGNLAWVPSSIPRPALNKHHHVP